MEFKDNEKIELKKIITEKVSQMLFEDTEKKDIFCRIHWGRSYIEVYPLDVDTGEVYDEEFRLNDSTELSYGFDVDEYMQEVFNTIKHGTPLTKELMIDVKNEMIAEYNNGVYIKYGDYKLILEKA